MFVLQKLREGVVPSAPMYFIRLAKKVKRREKN
jgi:hypothetical protein